MKERLLLTLLSITVLHGVTIGQSFLNGDLEGQSLPYDTPVPDWQYLDFNDINCLATNAGGVTSDIISATGPNPGVGMVGTPYSGQTFVAGEFTKGSSTLYQEGIQQAVSGFQIGQRYEVSFYQANVKTVADLDTSGNWMVILDDSVIGITEATVSHEAFDNVSLVWERRKVQFTATNELHTIKFLPFDDDTIRTAWLDLIGGLYMGIDSISLYSAPPSSTNNTSKSADFNIYPNPTESGFKIDGVSLSNVSRVRIYNSMGVLASDKQLILGGTTSFNLPEVAGLYHVEILLTDGTTKILKAMKK